MQKTIYILFLSFFGIALNNLQSQIFGTFTDPRDGNIYKTVKINNQIWMAENLKYKLSTSRIRSDSLFNRFGISYSYFELSQLAPLGWRIPTEKDYIELIDYFRNDDVANRELLEGGSSGFNAQIGNTTGFATISESVFWTSTNYSDEDAISLVLNYCKNRKLVFLIQPKKFTYSVRLIKE